jgi:hypothetical protein
LAIRSWPNGIFRLSAAATGGTPQWTEQWIGSNDVRMSGGCST